MPMIQLRGAQIRYEVLGQSGPWVALTPGGRRGHDEVLSIAEVVAAAGHRVLVHDRRNCGASSLLLEAPAGEAEHEVWADDQQALLEHLGAESAVIGGSSSGCRLSISHALRHPRRVRALLLWKVTGGAFAARRLASKYYGEYLDAARAGGMAAVCATPHFSACLAAQPDGGVAERARLMAFPLDRFTASFERWHQGFLDDADLPVLGASAAQLGSIGVPALVVPGDDNTHPQTAGEALARLLGQGRLEVMFPEHQDVDVADEGPWIAREREIAARFVEFLGQALR
jgi:pimeloyl-ACP methyl ester carboxylesterase